MKGRGTSNQCDGEDENDDKYYDYEEPPVRMKKSHKRELVPYSNDRASYALKYYGVGETIVGELGTFTDERNERSLLSQDIEAPGTVVPSFVMKSNNLRRRGGGKAKCKERSLVLRQGRRMKYSLQDAEEEVACLSDCAMASSGAQTSLRTRVKSNANVESQPFPLAAISLPSSSSPLSTNSPISKRTKPLIPARSLPPLPRQASTRQHFLDDVGECPPNRREFLSRYLPLLHSNLIATRDRTNISNVARTAHWGSGDSATNNVNSSSSHAVGIRELWREMLLWLQDCKENVLECHFQHRDELAAQMAHDVSTFTFVSSIQEEDLNPELTGNYLWRLHECMLRVDALLQQVDRLSYLCLSQRHLCTLYPDFASSELRQRLASMYMWRRMVHHLNSSIYVLFDHLGAHRQSYAPMLIDFELPLINREETLDLCVYDVAQFEDDVLIKGWPNYLRAMCVGSYPPLQSSVMPVDEHSQMEGCLNTIPARNSLYRKYVNKNIHRDGLAQLRQDLKRVLNSVIPFAVHSLKLDAVDIDSSALLDIEELIRRLNTAELQLGTEGFGEWKHMDAGKSCQSSSSSECDSTQESPSVWCDAFKSMQLPSFLPHFLFLVRCPVDILYQCMLARCDSSTVCNPPVQNGDKSPTELIAPLVGFAHDLDPKEDVIDYATVVQLFRECKETLLGAIQAKLYFQQMTMQVLPPSYCMRNNDLYGANVSSHGTNGSDAKECWRCLPEDYDKKLHDLMQDYFRYLWHILTRMQDCQESLLELSGFDSILENEWKFMKIVSPHIADGEVEASRLFCRLVAFFVKSIEQFISKAWNELVRTIDKERSDIELADAMASFNDTDADQNMMADEDDLTTSDEDASDDAAIDSVYNMGMELKVDTAYSGDTHPSYAVPQFSLEDGTPLSSSPCDNRWNVSTGNLGTTNHSSGDTSNSKMRRLMMKSLRDIEDIFDDAKKRLQKAADNIKFLCKDLQLAASMNFTQSVDSNDRESYVLRHAQEQHFLNILLESNHVLVNCDRHAQPDHLSDEEHHDPCSHFDSGKISLFVPQSLASNGKRILELLSMTFGDCPSDHDTKDENLEYLLFVECGLDDSVHLSDPLTWTGKRMRLHSNVDHTVKLSHAEVSGILMMTADGCQLERLLKHLLAMCPPGLIEVRDPHRACNQSIVLALDQLKEAALNLGEAIPETIARMQEHLLMIHFTMDTIRVSDSLDTRATTNTSGVSTSLGAGSVPGFTETSVSSNLTSPLTSGSNPLQGFFSTVPSFGPAGSSSTHANKVREKFRDCMQRCYRTAFFYHRELLRLTTKLKVRQSHLAPSIVCLLEQWMTFLRNYYEKSPPLTGGGLPSWAHDGCVFLQSVLQSNLTILMSATEWNILQNAILSITPHLMGVSLDNGSHLMSIDGAPTTKFRYATYASQVSGTEKGFHEDASVYPNVMLNNQFSQPAWSNSESKESHLDMDYRRAFSIAGLKQSSGSELVAGDSLRICEESLQKSIPKISLLSPVDEVGRDFTDEGRIITGSSPSLRRESSYPGTTVLDGTADPSNEKSSILEVRQSMLEELERLDEVRTTYLQKFKIIGHVRDSGKDKVSQQCTSVDSVKHEPIPIRNNPEPFTPAHFQPCVRQVNFEFKIGRKLGKGTFGEVYEAIRLDTNESVVVKRIKRHTLNTTVVHHYAVTSPSDEDGWMKRDEQMVADVLREFDMCVTLCHPNLVRYYGIEITGQESLIFMERCPGRTLASMVDQNLEELVIRKYANKLLQGLAYLHDKNIVHRDIKPENIMLCEPTDPNLLKLTDFGSATRTPPNFSSLCIRGSISQSVLPIQEMHGTPNYMAPEVCRSGDHGVKCDIWSFACVIWELFEGKRPHHASNRAHILYKMAMWQEDDETLPLYRPKGTTDDSWSFISSCLRRNPEERPSSVELLGSDFVKVVVSSLNHPQQQQ